MKDQFGVSRRSVIGGLATAAAVPLLGVKAIAAPRTGGLIRELELTEGGETGPRYLHSAVGLEDGRVLVTGGYLGQRQPIGTVSLPTGSVQIYDPSSGEWTAAPSLLIPRARHATVVLNDGTVAVLGGFANGPIDAVEFFDPLAGRWVLGNPLPMPICDHTATSVNGTVVLLGGQLGTRVCHVSVRPTGNRTSA